nr:MAG TPA: hypothetical protein [Caudoviricetes sp.]
MGDASYDLQKCKRQSLEWSKAKYGEKYSRQRTLYEAENKYIGQSVRLIKRITSGCLSLPLLVKRMYRVCSYRTN